MVLEMAMAMVMVIEAARACCRGASALPPASSRDPAPCFAASLAPSTGRRATASKCARLQPPSAPHGGRPMSRRPAIDSHVCSLRSQVMAASRGLRSLGFPGPPFSPSFAALAHPALPSRFFELAPPEHVESFV